MSRRDLEFPLELVTYLTGDAGAGPSAPTAYPTESGTIVMRAGAVSLFTRDLRDEIWRLPVGGWSPEAVVADDRVWVGPFDGFVMAIRVCDGRVVGKIPCEGIGAVYAAGADGVVLHRGGQLDRLEPDGRVRWTAETTTSVVIAHQGRVIITQSVGHRVVCLDDQTGREVWRLNVAPPGSDLMRARVLGRDRLCVLDRDVFAMTLTGEAYTVDFETGEVTSRERAPQGVPLARGGRLFFKSWGQMSEYDPHTHRLRVVDDHTAELTVEPAPMPSVRGWCFTDRAMVWTNGDGEFVGIARAGAWPRNVWRYKRRDGDMAPPGQHPIVGDGYLYFTQMSMVDEPGLMCFASA